jgi:amino acid transporter
VEITAASILLTFWDANPDHAPIYTAVIGVLVCSINIFGVKYFGEAEFYLSLIKISLIVGLILCGLVLDLGGGPDHERTGFRYWRHPGPLAPAGLVSNINTDRFLAILSVIVQAAFSFQGMELVAVAASETENPRRNIKKAVRRVFYRILLFYLLGILIIGMLVAYDDERLLRTDATAHASPFVIAIDNAGVRGLPHVINAAVFTSAFSAGNSFLYCASRILYGLSLRGQAPKIFSYCTKSGLPIAAVIAASLPALLSFMNVKEDSAQIFDWFVNLTTIGGFFSWISINITYLRFRKGMQRQGFDLTKNVYYNSWQPYVAYWGIFWLTIFILINGFEVFWDFNAADFLTAYINIPLFFSFFLGWKIIKKTKFWKVDEMDFVTGIPSIEETESPEVPPRTIGEKIAAVLF